MKRPIKLIIAILLSVQSFGQHNSEVDSLIVQLEKAKEDTFKVEILLRLFNPTVVNDLDQAYTYTQQAHELSERLSFDKGIAAAYQRKGIIWGYRGNVNKARQNYLKAIEVHERLNHPVVAATLVHNIGMLYKEQGIYDSAQIFAEKASVVFLGHNDSLKYASSLDMLSSIYEEQGYYYQSLKCATEAVNLFHKYKDELREADALVKIGSGYTLQKKFSKAIEYYFSAIQLYQKHNDKQWENFTMQRVVEVYIQMDELDKADSIIDYSIMQSDSLGANQALAEGLDIKGEVYYQKGEYQKALNYFEKAAAGNTEADDLTFNTTNQISQARCHQQLGEFEKALDGYLSALSPSIDKDVKENQSAIYMNVSEIYEQKGNKNLALDYYKKYVNVKDEITNHEKSRLFADIQIKYDTERKEREIAIGEQRITILEQRSEIQDLLKMRLIVTLIVIVVFFILGIYALWERMKKNRLKQKIENNRLTHELDLKKRELTTHTLHIIQKNELLENLQNKVTELKKKDSGSSYNEITRLINTNRLIERDWENFKSVFEQVHPDFFSKLKTKYDAISSNELRMAAMIKMNLNTKEMASILNITPESVKKARYRMRKKLELEPQASVSEYLMSI